MMDYQHKDLADGRWAQMSFGSQMANIGSEISRANRWKRKGDQEHCANAVYRALELLAFTIDAQRGRHSLKEFTRLQEIIPDFFLYDNELNTDGVALQSYFDKFAVK